MKNKVPIIAAITNVVFPVQSKIQGIKLKGINANEYKRIWKADCLDFPDADGNK